MGKPTQEVIEQEIARRDAIDARRRVEQQFRNRADYQHAQDIMNALQVISPEKHILDRLTPEEWGCLRDKLCNGSWIVEIVFGENDHQPLNSHPSLYSAVEYIRQHGAGKVCRIKCPDGKYRNDLEGLLKFQESCTGERAEFPPSTGINE